MSVGKISHSNDYYFEYVKPSGLDIRSLVGVIYTEPVVYDAYPSKFLDDETFKLLIRLYLNHFLTKERRKKVINLLNRFFDGDLDKVALKRELKKLLSEKEKGVNIDLPDNGEAVSTSKSFSLFNAGEGSVAFKRTLEIEVEGSEYIFSEGVKYKALKETLSLLETEFPYMAQFGEALESLEPIFEGKLLNTLTDIGSKTLLVSPQFLEAEENKVVYSLKMVNLFPDLKAQKIVEKYPLVLENLKKLLLKANGNRERVEKVLKTFQKNRPLLLSLYQKGEYFRLLKTYLILKAYRELMLADRISEPVLEELKEKIPLLVNLYQKQLSDKERLKNFLKTHGEKVGKGNVVGAFSFNLEEKIGKVLAFERLNSSKLQSLFRFKAFPFKEVFFHRIETLGELLDTVLVAYALSKQVDSIVLSIPSSETGLEYRRLKATLNLFVNNQTITERGYSALRFGKDNILRSLQKVERKGEVRGDFKLKEPISVIVETHPTNRIAEVSREDYEKLNEQTAHRLFRVLNLYPKDGSLEIESAGYFGLLAGDFETAEMVADLKELFNRILFITTTLLSPKSVEKLLKRLLGENFRYTLVNLEDVNFLLEKPLPTTEGVVKVDGDIVEFLRPLPPAVAKRALNERGFRYRILHQKMDTDTLIKILSALHLYASDSKNFPFADLKLSKQRLGSIELKRGKVYFSIALLEAFLRLKRLEA